MSSLTLRTSYRGVLRAIRQTCRGDPYAEHQITGAVKSSIYQLFQAQAPESDIVKELDLTSQMITMNMTQANYNPELNSYTVRLTEEMVPKDGVTVDIKTAEDLLNEQKVDLDQVVARHSQ
jgi:hypothetical protein